MRRLFLHFLLVFFLSSGLGLLSALEIEFTGGINSFTFEPRGKIIPPEEEEEEDDVEIIKDKFSHFMIGNFSVKGEISNSSAFHVNLERDNIQQNSINFRLSTRMDNFKFEFGPFIGFSDDFELDIGLSGCLEVTFPGIVFFSLSGASTMGTRYSFTSDNSRESVEIKLGFWLPIVIPTLVFNTKSFTQDDTTNNLTRVFVSAEFFGKTSPVIFRLDAGYEILERTIEDETNKLDAVFAGFELNIKIAQARIIAGAEIPFVLPSGTSDTFFKAYAGVAYSFY
ncbi:MAG: hypothetical protein FWB86_07955 [Treponema sp.]|nr:hypothetical protein [Treponema sp.]MCL2252037.1 hypothetical protein [Treponema sp.]